MSHKFALLLIIFIAHLITIILKFDVDSEGLDFVVQLGYSNIEIESDSGMVVS